MQKLILIYIIWTPERHVFENNRAFTLNSFELSLNTIEVHFRVAHGHITFLESTAAAKTAGSHFPLRRRQYGRGVM